VSIYSNNRQQSTDGMGSTSPLLSFLLMMVSGWVHAASGKLDVGAEGLEVATWQSTDC